MDLLNFINPIHWIEKIFHWLGRPKPEVKFEYLLSSSNENNYCHLRRNTTFNGKLGWFFRIGVDNNGLRRIGESDVRVEKIKKLENGNYKNIPISPFFLHWANENTDNSRSIYKNSEVFCDVVFTAEDLNKIFIFHKAKHSGAGVPSYLDPGKYIFHIKLLGANISPLEKSLKIDFSDKWDNLKMELV